MPDSDKVPVDLTGCSARMQLRAEVLAPDVLLELTTENDGISLAADGWISFLITADQSSALPFGDSPPQSWQTAVSQLEVVHANGDVSRPVAVRWKLDPEGTR